MSEKMKNINENDRRVKRTKRSLREALFKLLQQKPVNHISVTELTKLADVNRATFYFYYDDIFDMLEQIQNETYNVLEKIIGDEDIPVFASAETLSIYIEKVLVFCNNNTEMCRFVINNDINNQFFDRVKTLIASRIPNSKDYFPENDSRRYITQFIMSALSGVVFDWLNEGMKVPPSELAKTMSTLYFSGAEQAKK